MVARSTVAVAITLAGTWVTAGPAAALEPGVFVDPGSPASKEYSIPLSVLRGAGSGRPAIEGQPQPLFGIGITPAGAPGPEVSTTGRISSQRRRRGSPVQSKRGSPGSQVARGASGTVRAGGAAQSKGPVLAGISTGHGSSAPAVALFSALVVLGGLALGALLIAARRRLH